MESTMYVIIFLRQGDFMTSVDNEDTDFHALNFLHFLVFYSLPVQRFHYYDVALPFVLAFFSEPWLFNKVLALVLALPSWHPKSAIFRRPYIEGTVGQCGFVQKMQWF